MRALVFSEKDGLRVDLDRAKPIAAANEALIKVKRAGAPCCSLPTAYPQNHIAVQEPVLK